MLGVSAPTLDPDGLDLALRAAARSMPHGGSAWKATHAGAAAACSPPPRSCAIVAAVVPSRTLRDGGAPNRLNSLTMTFSISDGSVRTTDLVSTATTTTSPPVAPSAWTAC
ncbi:MAG: hypothetical protein U0802_03220 [Candidatus Binatia bacterium]